MRVFKFIGAACMALSLAGVVASARTPMPFRPAPPPGTIVNVLSPRLFGHGPMDLYRIFASRSPLGHPAQDQWSVSMYGQDADRSYRRIFQSPGTSDPFNLVPALEQGHGTSQYFPHETVTLVGAAALMGEPRDQVLVLVHAAAADCGTSTLSVLALRDRFGPVEVPVQVRNPCDLTARIVGHAIILSGPYYNASAPLYKPTKNKAVATLHYANGAWVERPAYFKLQYPRVPAQTVTPLTHPTPIFTPIFKAILTSPAPSGPPRPPRR